MNTFPRIPASKKSLSLRRPIFGIAINDSDYITDLSIDGERMTCPYYKTWKSILQRCYDPKYHKIRPTYKDCFACDEWLIFSNFRGWMIEQDWEGKVLDKDILIPGNKEYSPDKCLFVSQSVNSLLNKNMAQRGALRTGVYMLDGKHAAQCNYKGKQVYLGMYNTEEAAELAYKKVKYAEIVRVAFMQKCERTAEGLLKHAVLLLTGNQ